MATMSGVVHVVCAPGPPPSRCPILTLSCVELMDGSEAYEVIKSYYIANSRNERSIQMMASKLGHLEADVSWDRCDEDEGEMERRWGGDGM